MCIYTDALVDCFIAPLRVDVVYTVCGSIFYHISRQSTCLYVRAQYSII